LKENIEMYAVIKTGGKQYVVNEGDTLKVEKLDGEVGSSLEFDTVLAVGDGGDIKVGSPTVEGAKVKAEILAHGKAKKIIVFKKKKRKGYAKKQGHRQLFTDIKIQEIKA
jgi:large subunit ribosomal protein L21